MPHRLLGERQDPSTFEARSDSSIVVEPHTEYFTIVGEIGGLALRKYLSVRDGRRWRILDSQEAVSLGAGSIPPTAILTPDQMSEAEVILAESLALKGWDFYVLYSSRGKRTLAKQREWVTRVVQQSGKGIVGSITLSNRVKAMDFVRLFGD